MDHQADSAVEFSGEGKARHWNRPLLPLRRIVRPGFDYWTLSSLLIASAVALPILSVLILSFFPEENIWGHLASTVLPGYIQTTLLLMSGVMSGTLLIGVVSAWLVTMCAFPGRRWFEWALLLPFAIPAYVIAYVYTDLLEYAGPLQTAFRGWFGWQNAADYWFPAIRSLPGAIIMMSLVMYPYVYLLARAAFLEQSPHLSDVSRTLGHGPWRSFFRVSLPIARPAIAVGLALVMMETLNDFGTVDYFAVRTLTAGIYDVWLGMGNLGGGAQIASVMLLFVAVLIMLERSGRRKQRYFQSGKSYRASRRYQLKGWSAGLATVFCLIPFLLGFLLPTLVLANYAYSHFAESWTEEFRDYIFNSLFLSASAALLTVMIGVFIAYSRRLHNSKLLLLATRFASLGYAMPGAVLAIGVMIPLASFDNTLDQWLRDLFGISSGLLLSGTVFALIFAYSVRFLAVSIGAVEASLGKVTPSMDMVARSLGETPMVVLKRVHLPLIRGGIMTAALVVFVDCMKELPATLILRPFNFDTLATYVYQFASDELLEECALGALLIVLVGLLPMLLLNRTISQSNSLTSKS